MSEFRKRILEPLSLPVGAAVLIAILVFSASRILLAVEEAASTIIALVIAAEVLGVAAVLAAGAKLKNVQRGILLLTGLGLIAGGGASANIGIRDVEKVGVVVSIAAKGIAYTTPVVEFPPDTDFALKFVNNDGGVPHDVNVTKDVAGAQSLFKTKVFNGVASQAIKVAPLESTTYFFHCDVHPAMKGRLVPEGQAGPPPPSAPPSVSPSPSPSPPAAGKGPTSTTVSAANIAFDTASFTLRSGSTDTITFVNKDVVPHNIVITSDEAGAQKPIFREEPIQGGKTATWTLTGPSPGTYYFHCEIHPNMKGKTIFT